MTTHQPRLEGPSRRWMAVAIVVCSVIGIGPLVQALELLGENPRDGAALYWQAGSAIVWIIAAPRIARRWSLADSEAGALGGLALFALLSSLLSAWLILALVQPPSSYAPRVASVELTFALLPTHALMTGVISLVGSWTSARRQRARAADRETVLTAAAVRAELDALRTRLQPHFLLNALNTIVGLARRHDGERAADVAADLGELLRFALAESGDAVPFDAEREIVERYLAIEQVRLGDRLVVLWQLDPSARTTQLPALVWQPLVENAIRHGIALRTAPGRLLLSATRQGDSLLLVVDADGPDAPEHARPPRDALGGLGVGLPTVQRRLELLYGERSRVTLTMRADGSCTTLVIPQPRQ